MLAEFRLETEQSLYALQVADKLGVPVEALKNDIKSFLRNSKKWEFANEIEKEKQKSLGIGNRINPEFAKEPKRARDESQIIGILLLHPEMLEVIDITTNDFCTSFGKKVLSEILNIHNSSGVADLGQLSSVFSPEEMGQITKMYIDAKKLFLDSEAYNENIALLRKKV